MVPQQIKQTLFQFKRIYKRQIEPKTPISTINKKIHRKVLNSLDKCALKQLVKQIIIDINRHQKNREKPHQGLESFKQTLLEQLDTDI